jgi:murein DD-endopeptidase MepM/ murein hydrolase activator NlpD
VKHPKLVAKAFMLMLVSCLLACQFPIPEEQTQLVIPAFQPQVKYNLLVNYLHTEDHEVKRNQQFVELLQGYKVSNKAWQRLNTLSRNEFDFRKVKVGQPYTLFIQPDSVCSLRAMAYEVSLADYVVFYFDDTLRLEYCQKEIITEEKSLSGLIDNNLSEAISSQGVSHELTNRMVDILGWQIDFYHLQKGDHFKITYRQKSVEGKSAGIAEVTGIVFNHAGKELYAIPFDQGEGLDYFDQNGNSIRRAFLKYPIEFTHIASRYSLKRFHPVLKVYRPHLGTDLSASTGTPIRTVGDGTIVEIGYNGGSGNYVKVRHNATYTTGYLHMSRFASGMRRGTTVKQGNVIGYVGSTGWSTGPHLCYRFWKNGIQVDALKVQIPPAKPVRPERIEAFECLKQETLMKLNDTADPMAMSVAMKN